MYNVKFFGACEEHEHLKQHKIMVIADSAADVEIQLRKRGFKKINVLKIREVK